MRPAGDADLSDGLPPAAHDQPHLAAGDADHLGHLLALDPSLEAESLRMRQAVVVEGRPTASNAVDVPPTAADLNL